MGRRRISKLFYVWQEIAKRVNQAAQLQEPYLAVNILSPEENEHNVKVSNETIILRQMVRYWTIYLNSHPDELVWDLSNAGEAFVWTNKAKIENRFIINHSSISTDAHLLIFTLLRSNHISKIIKKSFSCPTKTNNTGSCPTLC